MMDEVRKIVETKKMLNIPTTDYTQDEVIRTYLNLAGELILRKAFPFDSTKTEVPERYAMLQCQIAVRMKNTQGVEGEVYHSENGVVDQWGEDSGTAFNDLLKSVTPYCGVI